MRNIPRYARAPRGNIPSTRYSTCARSIFRHIVSVAMPRDRSKSNQLFFNIYLYVPAGMKTHNGAPYIRAAIRVPGRDAMLGEFLKQQKTPFALTVLSKEHVPPEGIFPSSRFPFGETDLHFEGSSRLSSPEEDARDGSGESAESTGTTAIQTHAETEVEIARCLETLSRLCTRSPILGKRMRGAPRSSAPRPNKLRRVVPAKEATEHSATDTDIDVM